MAGGDVSRVEGLRVFPPPPKGFDVLAATRTDLARHGIPQRPDARTQPVLAALWDRRLRRYQHFDHLAPEIVPGDKPARMKPALGLEPVESCGFELFSSAGAITMLQGTWTVPSLNHSADGGPPLHVRTFFGLGFLDLHVELTVDSSENVTTAVRIHTGATVALPVRPGDTITGTLCLEANSAGTAFYGIINETTSQTVNFTIDTGFPPAVTINAGVSRGSLPNGLPEPLARFGVVYFDELIAFSMNGTKLLTNGTPTTMTDLNGSTLAIVETLNENAFKVIYRGS